MIADNVILDKENHSMTMVDQRTMIAIHSSMIIILSDVVNVVIVVEGNKVNKIFKRKVSFNHDSSWTHSSAVVFF